MAELKEFAGMDIIDLTREGKGMRIPDEPGATNVAMGLAGDKIAMMTLHRTAKEYKPGDVVEQIHFITPEEAEAFAKAATKIAAIARSIRGQQPAEERGWSAWGN